MKYDIGAESQAMLESGHDEIRQTECYDNYCVPTFIR